MATILELHVLILNVTAISIKITCSLTDFQANGAATKGPVFSHCDTR